MTSACVRAQLGNHVPLSNSRHCSQPGSSAHGILHARVLEWVAISYSRASSQPRESNLCGVCLLHKQVDFYHRATWNVKKIHLLM